jgi:hypothetical protein
VARNIVVGLQIDDAAASSAPGYFHVTIRSTQGNNAGGANDFVRVEVDYNHPVMPWILGTPYIALHAEALVLSERFARPTGQVGVLPNTPVPLPTRTPTPVPTRTRTPVP